MTIQTPSISTNRNTNVVVEMVRQAAIRSSEIWQELNPGYEDQDELDMEFSAYCILSDHLRQRHLSDYVVDELIRLYPEQADEAVLSHYEWENDI